MDALAPKRRAKRPTVVVLEDDHGVRRSLQLLLEAKGFEVKAYASPSALLADPAVLVSSCLIADFLLPETDGLAVLQALRTKGWDGPALLMTAYGTEALATRALAAGFSEVLEKPFREHALIQALSKVLA